MWNKELIWPGIMLIASITNVIGASVAIVNGDGNNSVAFKTGLFTSVIYATGHLVKIGQEVHKGWVQRELERRTATANAVTPLESITTQR